MKSIALISIAPLLLFAGTASACPEETVILIHGLNRSHSAMSKLAKALTASRYTVINCDYPSRSADIETLATDLFATLAPRLASASKVHFVTHSMGGILLRAYLQKHAMPNMGRVVMLGPPNRGSEIVDRLGSLKLFQWFNGPAGTQLGTGTDSLPLRLKAPDFELGVIAGDRSINPILSLLIPGHDDGKVSVDRAKTEGMRDFICLHVTHTCMIWNRQVIQQTQHFLKTGCFKKNIAIALSLFAGAALSAEPTNAIFRIGTYDSRAIAVAFVGSQIYKETDGKTLNEKMKLLEQAKSEGKQSLVSELEAWGQAQQQTLHKQGFSTAPVDNILKHIQDQLPAIAKSAGVDILVSKWDKDELAKHQAAKVVDVTPALIDAFHPTERQRKSAVEIQQHPPMPLRQAENLHE